MDVELYNVSSIMLRNISLGLALVSTVYLLFFVTASTNLWNLVLAVIAFCFSIIAIRSSWLRRHWFYVGIFESFVAYYLFQEKPIGDRQYVSYKDYEGEAQDSMFHP